jgi:superfamily II DNA/RNA helicase
MVFARSIEWMVDQGYLCPPRGKRISIDIDLSKVKKSHGDFQADALADALEDADALDDILATYVEHGEERKTLIFCPTVAMAHHTAAVFRDSGLAAEAVDGTTPQDERHGILQRLHTGETQIVANVGVLTEGFDEPSIGCIIIAAPTKSRVKYTQIVGRGLRLYPGKEDCLILDVVGASEDNSIQSLPALFGLASLLDDEDVVEGREREAREAAEREEEEAAGRQEQESERDERRRRNAESIQFFGRGRMNWTTIDDKWTIPVDGPRTIVLWPTAGEHFDVLLLNEEKESFKFLARSLDMGYAQGAAEETIRKHGNRLLADSKAAWREDKPTPGQTRYLARHRLPPATTKGEASDRIARHRVAGLLERVERALIEREARSHDYDLERVA